MITIFLQIALFLGAGSSKSSMGGPTNVFEKIHYVESIEQRTLPMFEVSTVFRSNHQISPVLSMRFHRSRVISSNKSSALGEADVDIDHSMNSIFMAGGFRFAPSGPVSMGLGIRIPVFLAAEARPGNPNREKANSRLEKLGDINLEFEVSYTLRKRYLVFVRAHTYVLQYSGTDSNAPLKSQGLSTGIRYALVLPQ
jgi:hypothetical protein